MVDVEKAKKSKVRKNKNRNLPDIDLKSLVYGSAAYAFFPLIAYQHNIDLIMAFAAIGPLYIGYKSKTKLKSFLLGIVGGTPLLYLAFMGYLGPYGVTEIADIIMTITILGLSALMGFFGSYLYRDRLKAKEKYEKDNNLKGTKNVPKEMKKKKFEDTGSVKQNIINLFKPRKK